MAGGLGGEIEVMDRPPGSCLIVLMIYITNRNCVKLSGPLIYYHVMNVTVNTGW